MARLPKTGKWLLVDSRYFGSLFGGVGPPFGTMSVNFHNRTGTVSMKGCTSLLTNIIVRGIGSFSAKYSSGKNRGKFNATIRDDAYLEINFSGSWKESCTASPIKLTLHGAKRIAILTCVGNPGLPTGPGHSALIADSVCYTFENMGSNFSTTKSGWDVLKTTKYLKRPDNLKRPVIIQEIDTSKVKPKSVLTYIHGSMVADDDYGTSGVCSSQVANAIEAGIKGKFNTRGLDKPRDVYLLAKSKRIVKKSYYIWDPKLSGDSNTQFSELRRYYSGSVKPSTGADVRTW